MEKMRKIINGISWGIVVITGILLIIEWNDIPALVITHIGTGISYGSKNLLPILFCIELVVTVLFTLHYDIPLVRDMRKLLCIAKRKKSPLHMGMILFTTMFTPTITE